MKLTKKLKERILEDINDRIHDYEYHDMDHIFEEGDMSEELIEEILKWIRSSLQVVESK